MSRYSTAEQVAAESRRVERVYGALARVYDGFFDWALGPGRREAVRMLSMRPGARVLEVGVGTGLALPDYPRDCRLTGIDISDAMLHRARARADELGLGNVELRRMDARALDFPDECFDHVLAPYVVSVVPDPAPVLEEMRRVSKVGADVIVVNRFRSEMPVLRTIEERWLTPLTQWVGFRLDLPLRAVTDVAGLEVVQVRRVNLFGIWRLVVLRRVS